MGKKSNGTVEQVRYLEITVINQNSIYEEIESRQGKECFLPFIAATLIFQFTAQEYDV
jgi:hypothetical protein